MSRRGFLLLLLSRRLWVQALAFAVAAVAAAVVAAIVGARLDAPADLVRGAQSLEAILALLASSMLAVATFSLATLISAFSTVQMTASPRAAALLIEDRSAQTALSGFVGAFIFAVVGLLALSTGAFGPGARAALFVETAIVLALVVVALVQWIDEASRLGLMSETLERVERATGEGLAKMRRRPILRERQERPHPGAPLVSATVGYVQLIDVALLEAEAERLDATVWLEAAPGAFTDGIEPLARVESARPLAEAELHRLASAFVVDETRAFDQDPGYGLVLLREIACRALSPALNDTGTAIAVIGSAVRVLRAWSEADAAGPTAPPASRVHGPAVAPSALFDEVFTPVARDAAGLVEVGCRLQAAFASLASLPAPGFSEAARTQALLALERARDARVCATDLARLERAARPLLGDAVQRPLAEAEERRAAVTLP